MNKEYIAHKTDDGKIQTVKDHLENTARMAGDFAAVFGAREVGYTAGLLHDIGKYSDQFQDRIQGASLRVDHSTAGAQVAFGRRLPMISFAVAGHHSGIPDGGSRMDTGEDKTLLGRMKRNVPDCSAWEKEIRLSETKLPDWVNQDGYTDSFFTRMIYSCLVDADYLDTETFYQGEQPRGKYESLLVLLIKLRAKTDQWLKTPSCSDLNHWRNNVLRCCIHCGREWTRGLYTLTVPTGGGKTVASLSFAMEQAAALDMDRIIYVVPYTSIIDQTVEVFRGILGEENVLAHYGNADFQLENREDLSPLEYRRLLASENWDAPVIVTTAVQFFESLYANKSSKCRKLHNIANSIILFDEAQTLPIAYLRPCIAAIVQLVKHYRATAVLCTATQPELGPFFQEYDLSMKEVCSDYRDLYQILKRTELEDLGEISQEDMAKCLCTHEQVLCVVNRRKTAQEIYQALPEEGRFCLTTLLCSSDRKEKLKEIRRRLREGLPCRVVSTSLIEAGVDVDFPAAYREEAGLDSILQTAGRCNREGREKDSSKCPVCFFHLRGVPVPQMMRQSVTALRAVKRKYEKLDQPEAIESYFRNLYKIKGEENLDKNRILDAFTRGIDGKCFPFATVADKFSIIDSSAKTVYIPFGEGENLCRQLCEGEISRTLIRKLGPYSVGIFDDQFMALEQAGSLEVVADGEMAVLRDMNQYDKDMGLKSDDPDSQAFFL